MGSPLSSIMPLEHLGPFPEIKYPSHGHHSRKICPFIFWLLVKYPRWSAVTATALMKVQCLLMTGKPWNPLYRNGPDLRILKCYPHLIFLRRIFGNELQSNSQEKARARVKSSHLKMRSAGNPSPHQPDSVFHINLALAFSYMSVFTVYSTLSNGNCCFPFIPFQTDCLN